MPISPSVPPSALRRTAAAASAPLAAGCGGAQSQLTGAGREAALVEALFWPMLAGAVVIWALVVGLMLYATQVSPGPHSARGARRLILWGGIVAPTVVIAALLTSGLFVFRDMTTVRPTLSVAAKGERWWWRIAYPGPDGALVPAPNELRLPAGETAEIALSADDVIHSFWAPSLGGKMDMIPGRVNRMTLTPVEPGVYRGACAEYCGGAHAQMAFPVVVMAPEDFAAWTAAQAEPARPPASDAERAGLDAFLAAGCGACHAIRGTDAEGLVGPDLTHVGSRLTIGAGLLPMGLDEMVRWIAATEEVKPGVLMPSFGALPEDEIRAIAAYLVSLE